MAPATLHIAIPSAFRYYIFLCSQYISLLF